MDIPSQARQLGLAEPDLAVALQAAQAAGEVIAAAYYYRQNNTTSTTTTTTTTTTPAAAEEQQEEDKDSMWEKSELDIVTQADLDAEQQILKVLTQAYPTDAILSEETHPTLHPVLSFEATPRLWVVDPLDGTLAFHYRAHPGYPSVMLALLKHGQPHLAVVLFPLTQEWFYAVRGQGAFKNEARLVKSEERDWRLRPPAGRPVRELWVEMNESGDCELSSPVFVALKRKLQSKAGARLVTCQAPHSGVGLRCSSLARGCVPSCTTTSSTQPR